MILEQKAFMKGMLEVGAKPGALGIRVRAELMTGLNLRSRQAFSRRAHGEVAHTPFEIEGIERIFREFGCNDPWGK